MCCIYDVSVLRTNAEKRVRAKFRFQGADGRIFVFLWSCGQFLLCQIRNLAAVTCFGGTAAGSALIYRAILAAVTSFGGIAARSALVYRAILAAPTYFRGIAARSALLYRPILAAPTYFGGIAARSALVYRPILAAVTHILPHAVRWLPSDLYRMAAACKNSSTAASFTVRRSNLLRHKALRMSSKANRRIEYELVGIIFIIAVVTIAACDDWQEVKLRAAPGQQPGFSCISHLNSVY